MRPVLGRSAAVEESVDALLWMAQPRMERQVVRAGNTFTLSIWTAPRYLSKASGALLGGGRGAAPFIATRRAWSMVSERTLVRLLQASSALWIWHEEFVVPCSMMGV